MVRGNLMKNTQYTDVALETALFGTIIADEKYASIYLNQYAEDFFGISNADVQGIDIRKLIHGKDQRIINSKHICQVSDPLVSGKSRELSSHVFRNVKNDPVWVEYTSHPILQRNKIRGLIVHFYDSTVVMKSFQEMLQLRAKYRIVFEVAVDATLIVNNNGVIQEANVAAENLFDNENLRQKSLFSFLTSQSKGVLKHIWEQVLANETLDATTDLEFKTKKQIHVEIAARTEVLPGQHVLIFHDLTQKKEEQLKRDSFIALVSHELRNPLAVLKTLTELAKIKLSKNALKPTSQYLEKMDEKIHFITDLLSSLVSALQIGTGKIRFNDNVEDFDRIVRGVIWEIKKASGKSKIRVLGQSKAKIRVDRSRISQVCSNLLWNAMKYSPEEKDVIVELRSDESSAFMSVQNFGKPISKSDISKLFQPFFRGAEAKEKRKNGMGMGLFVSKQIVDRYKGKLYVSSSNKHRTIFTMKIPRMEEK